MLLQLTEENLYKIYSLYGFHILVIYVDSSKDTCTCIDRPNRHCSKFKGRYMTKQNGECSTRCNCASANQVVRVLPPRYNVTPLTDEVLSGLIRNPRLSIHIGVLLTSEIIAQKEQT